MEYLGSENLFFSKYVIGCELPSNKNIDCIKTLHNWLYFKDNDYGMEKYRTDRTQYITFLNIIELPILKEIINDLIIIYKKEFPFSEKKDFIEQIFGYTLYNLEVFVEYENYTFYGTSPNIKNEVYNKYENGDNQYIEFITEPSKDIEYYKQYYKKAIQIINDLDYETPVLKSLPARTTYNKNMTDKIFIVNEKNYLDLEKEYEFTESEGEYIYRNFWPIIVVNSFDAEWVKNQLDFYKIEFIKENKIFDLDILKRNQTDFLISEINEYLDNLKQGKTKIWNERKDDYFHWFKLQSDLKSYTLLISDKNEIQLEIYFKTILAEIYKFIENEQVLPIQQVETKPEQQTGLFGNNFDKVKPIEIYNHFKAGLVDKGYLTEQELNEYLKAAFELQTIPETLFKFKDVSTKQKITNVFYQYFTNIAGTPHGKQKKYAALLGDYFVGYVTKNVSTNFNK